MSDTADAAPGRQGHDVDRRGVDTPPGKEFDREDIGAGVRGHLIGLAFALLLTGASFGTLQTSFVWASAIPIALIVFAIAQMGVHLVLFLHITTGPDDTNDVMALAFGVQIVLLLMGGSLWIMAYLNRAMTQSDEMKGMTMQMQR